jgi:hypothetical protein
MVDGNHDVADVTRRVVKISQKGELALNGNRVGNVHPDSDPEAREQASNIKLSYALIVESMPPMAPQDNH